MGLPGQQEFLCELPRRTSYGRAFGNTFVGTLEIAFAGTFGNAIAGTFGISFGGTFGNAFAGTRLDSFGDTYTAPVTVAFGLTCIGATTFWNFDIVGCYCICARIRNSGID